MRIIGCDKNFEQLKAIESSVQTEKGSWLSVQCDLTKEDQILAVFAKIREEFGGVDICVSNAGLCHDAPLLTGKTEDWRNMLEINVLAYAICAREAFKSMEERGVDDGHIIFLSSMSGHRIQNEPSEHMYTATKYAVRAMAEGIRNELVARKSHIRITSISPTNTKTNFMFHMHKDNPSMAQQIYGACMTLKPDDIADSIIYALSAPPHVQVDHCNNCGVICEQVHDILIRSTESPT